MIVFHKGNLQHVWHAKSICVSTWQQGESMNASLMLFKDSNIVQHTCPVSSTMSRSSWLLQPMPTTRPRSHMKAASACPAAVKTRTTGLVAAPWITTSLRSSRTIAIGPPYRAHATLHDTPHV